MRQSVSPVAHGSGDPMQYLRKIRERIMSAKLDRRQFIAAGTTMLAMPFVSRSASAQAGWPSRQIRMVCSYPAGGQTDLLARAYGEFISKQVGKTVVVENKPGAAGAIGTAEVARADLAELCVAANSDPKVKEVLNTFVLEPAIGFKETNALYQRELPIWIESARSLGLEPA
jgi:hypothetical protein